MAVRAGIQVEGAKEFRRTLKNAGDDLSDLKDAHRRAADVVVGASRMRVPKRKGRLAASLRGSGAKTAATVRAGGASVPYANPIHWGWPARGIKANPFITEAAQSTETEWVRLYEKEVERQLDKVKGV